MHHKQVCCPVFNEAIRYAAAYLGDLGFEIQHTADEQTKHLLLPVPSFPSADAFFDSSLDTLPPNIRISGGNFNDRLSQFQTVDFLKDAAYLADNAAITASCAIEIIKNRISSLNGCSVLIIGWGRIGKCLSHLLGKADADVTVAARKDTDRAMIHALGYRSISIADAASETLRARVILNTVPEMVLPNINAHPDCVILELASRPGMSGANITDARGLPNKMAPAASGKLIAQTFIRLSLGEEV